MQLALIHNGRVVAEGSAADRALTGPDDKPLFDIRDVSKVSGIVPGWLANADGTYSAPAAVAEPVPLSVSSAQAKIQLLRTPGSTDTKSLLDDVRAAVDAAGGEVAIWFSDARTWDRGNPYVSQLGKSLKLKAADIDALFVAAAQIAA